MDASAGLTLKLGYVEQIFTPCLQHDWVVGFVGDGLVKGEVNQGVRRNLVGVAVGQKSTGVAAISTEKLRTAVGFSMIQLQIELALKGVESLPSVGIGQLTARVDPIGAQGGCGNPG